MSSRQIIEKVITGEFPIALQVYSTQAAGSASRGVPIAWLPVAPVTGSFAATAITRRAAHPHAARLFVEFLLSREGQAIFRDADQLPARPDVLPADPLLAPRSDKFRVHYFNPDDLEAQLASWDALRRAMFP